MCGGRVWSVLPVSARRKHLLGVGGGAFVRGWVALAAADPEKVLGLKPADGENGRVALCGSRACRGWRVLSGLPCRGFWSGR